MVIVYKDEKVQCPECRTDLFRVTRDLRNFERLVETMFDALPGIPPVKNDGACVCSECGAGWCRLMEHVQIHIKNVGWV